MNPRRPRTIRRSFTLAELLVVIMVISILASSLLFAMFGAIQQAKESRTKSQITKLHELLMTRWDSYRTRSIRLLGMTAEPRRDARAVATARLLAIRDLMRMELPDRKADVLDGTLASGFGFTVNYNRGGTLTATPTLTVSRPACSREYLRRVANLVSPANLTLGAAAWTETYQDSECLYMIVASIQDIAGSGLDFLHEGEIGDLDEDGMPEILDSWGKPIAFIRWAPGFLEHPGPDFTFGTADDIPSYSNLQILDAEGSPDPFDPLRVDKRPPPPPLAAPWPAEMDPTGTGTAEYQFNFALFPLVVSSGPDELLDIVRFDYDPSNPSTQVAFNFYRSGTNPYPPPGWTTLINDPYSVLATCQKRLGEPFLESGGYKDNITNHGLGEGD